MMRFSGYMRNVKHYENAVSTHIQLGIVCNFYVGLKIIELYLKLKTIT